jgi:mycobactin peptide synthetase MbtE
MDADASSADLKTLLAELTDVRVYGAISQAETSGWTGGFRWREGHVNLFPIAQDAQVDTLSVLGPDLQRMPPGVEGDVYGAGPSLARGYVSSEPTPDRFVMHPETGARLFATGYLGRYESAGIRITRDRSRRTWYRGRYVSLDALESRLAEHPSVERAIVTDEHALVAELTLRDESESIDLADVQRQLGAAIPEGLPLRCVVARKRISGANDTIQTTTEEAVAMIWTAILGRQQIGAQENFFDLGANSFVASLVCANVATEFGITLSVVDIYNHPNLRSLSARIDDLAAGQAPSA